MSIERCLQWWQRLAHRYDHLSRANFYQERRLSSHHREVRPRGSSSVSRSPPDLHLLNLHALFYTLNANTHHSRELRGTGGEAEEMGLAIFSFAALNFSPSSSSPGVLNSISSGVSNGMRAIMPPILTPSYWSPSGARAANSPPASAPASPPVAASAGISSPQSN